MIEYLIAPSHQKSWKEYWFSGNNWWISIFLHLSIYGHHWVFGTQYHPSNLWHIDRESRSLYQFHFSMDWYVALAPFFQGPQSVLYTVGVTLYIDHIISAKFSTPAPVLHWQRLHAPPAPDLSSPIGSHWFPLVPTRSHSNHYKHRPFSSCRIDLLTFRHNYHPWKT